MKGGRKKGGKTQLRKERREGGMDGGRKPEKKVNLITLLRSGIVYSFSLTSHMTNSPTSGTKCSLLLH